MTILKTLMIGSAGLAATLAVASPAAAQGYPYGYPQQSTGGGIVGAIINSVTGGGYGQYPMGNYGYARTDSRTAVAQCAAAVERGQSGYGQGYNQGQAYGYQGQGYPGQGYAYGNQGYSGLRVVGITNVERRSNGGLRVSGIVQGGVNGAYGQPGYGQPGYGYQGQGYQGQPYANQPYGNAQTQSRFSCKVDSRGVVSEVRVNNRQAYRGY